MITNYAWDPLTFHVGLPQALKILESYPIYADARRAGLPDYVFGVEGARWLVWRWIWEGYQGYATGHGSDDADEEARHRRIAARVLRLRGRPLTCGRAQYRDESCSSRVLFDRAPRPAGAAD